MPALTIRVEVEIDGVPVAGFPWTRRREFDELQQFTYEKADGGGYVSLPIDQLATLQALILTTDYAITLRLDGQAAAGIEIGAHGLVALLGITADAGASTNATINNDSGSTATVRGIGAGT